MLRWMSAGCALSVLLFTADRDMAQSSAGAMADLVALRDKVGNPDTRTRVDALQRVWSIALGSPDTQPWRAARTRAFIWPRSIC
jgi:hypothetical protein